MHDIIKKALDEALTEKYYAELMGCEDTDYAFSGGFLSDMKSLIRKTDNKFLYYSKYIAASACAVVVIGCAVLLPVLMSDKIDVSDKDTTTTTTSLTSGSISADMIVTSTEKTTVPPGNMDETTLDTDQSDETASTTQTTEGNVTVPVEESDENPGSGGDNAGDVQAGVTETTADEEKPVESTADTQTDIKDEEDAEEAPPVDEEADAEADIEEDTEEDAEEEAEIEGDIIADEDDSNPTTPSIPSDDDVDNDVEEDTDDDVQIEDDSDDDVEIEDDADIEEDDAVEDEVEGDDVVIEDDDNENPECGGDSSYNDEIIPGNTMRELIENAVRDSVFDMLYLSHIEINNIDAENSGVSMYRFDDTILDYEYIREYIISCGDAQPYYPLSYAGYLKGEVMYVTMSTKDDSYTVSVYDNSLRNRYNEVFGGIPEEDVDEDDVEPLDEGEWIHFEISEEGGIIVNGYDGRPAFFQVDPEKAKELFDRVRLMNITENAATMGDIIDSAQINAENISRGTARIKNLYDIFISNVSFGTMSEAKAVADFFEQFRDTPVKRISDVPYRYSTYKKGVEIKFGLDSTSAIIRLLITEENKAVVSDGRIAYTFDITLNETKTLMKYICQWAGVAEPVFYETMEDYLKDKNFNSLKAVYYFVNENNKNMYYNITKDSGKLEKIYNMVLAEAGNMKYKPFDTGDVTSPQLHTEHWNFSVSKGGYIHIYDNCFKGPETLYNDIVAYVRANADESGCVDEEVEVEDDVEIEDEIDE